LRTTPETCPNCGEELPRRAVVCPACGSDEKTGWSEDAYASSLDLPEEEFDYDKFVEKEFGSEKKKLPTHIRPIWFITAILILISFAIFWFYGKSLFR
jgi:hypothetical protein